MKFRSLLFAAAGLFFACSSSAQSLTGTSLIHESILESVKVQNEANEYESLLLELEYLQQHPLNLNTVEETDLKKLPFLTDFQIQSFLEYRKKNGLLISIYELRLIYGFNEDVIPLILPYVEVRESADSKLADMDKSRHYASHDFMVRSFRSFEKSRGYRVYDSVAGDYKYPGCPWMINARYAFEIKDHIRAGITAEKDPGESFFASSNKSGFDFYSGFVQVNQAGVLESFIAGDYRLSFGQGLVLWNGISTGKSSLSMNIAKRQDEIKPYTSNDENNFFRGLAATASAGNFAFSAFLSSKHIDANLTDTLNTGHVEFTSFQESGYHRTASEITDERSLSVTAIGGNILFRNNYLKAGTTIVSYRFDKIMKAGENPEDIYDFTGQNLLNWGTDYAINLRKLQLFGETAYGNSHWGALHGAIFSINKYASFSLLYRDFQPGFLTLNSSAFSESSEETNERGLYTGLELHPVRRIKISAYADYFKFPWLKYRVSAPSSGCDFLTEIIYTINKAVCTSLRIKIENNPVDLVCDSCSAPQITDRHYTGIRYHVSYRTYRALLMQNRAEFVRSKKKDGESIGFLVYHDAGYSFSKIPLDLDFRIAWFKADDYNARIYTYEQDVSSGFSFFSLFDEGLRYYFMVRTKIYKRCTIALRYSCTQYFNRKTTGSGYDLVDSSSKNDLRLKIALNL